MNVSELHGKEGSKDSISRTAFHAPKEPQTLHERAITSLMPLFQETVHSAPMILHGMNIIRTAVQLLNPGQVPVIANGSASFCAFETNSVGVAEHT